MCGDAVRDPPWIAWKWITFNIILITSPFISRFQNVNVTCASSYGRHRDLLSLLVEFSSCLALLLINILNMIMFLGVYCIFTHEPTAVDVWPSTHQQAATNIIVDVYSNLYF